MPQLLRMEQVLQLRQVLRVRYLDVDPFRTDGENIQVSQYEIIEKLLKLIENGEYFDKDHFKLEVNRSVFSHPLEARLGNFGRDMHQLVTNYKSNDKTAKKIISAIASQKKENKDIPGQIAYSWNKIFNSNYFKKEAKQKRILSFIEFLNYKEADINSALDVVSKSSQIKNQPLLVNTSLEKIQNYSEADKRLIPFSQVVLSPILRALNLRKEKLSHDETNKLYNNIIEKLYMLDKDLRVENGVSGIADSISKKGLKETLETKITVPIQTLIDNLLPNENIYQKIIDLAENSDFKQGREIQRKLYKGLSGLEELDNGKEILGHVVENSKTIKSLSRILSSVNFVCRDRKFSYPFELQDENSILRNLKLQLVDKSIKRLGLNDETLEKYLSKLEGDERFERISKIITTLAGYSHYQNPEQISLLREIATTELNDNFNDWRYSHDLALEQLAVLDGKIKSWKENKTVKRVVGELDALNSHIDAIKKLAPKTYETYTTHYKEEIDDNTLKTLSEKIKENEEKLREKIPKNEKKELGFSTSLLREQAGYVDLLTNLKGLNVDNYTKILEKSESLAKRKSRNPLYETTKWIRETLDQPVYRDARKINVIETDNLEELLRMGEIPVPHCQNWKNDSTLNKSLLSFSADSNKKLYHISNGNNKPISMSMNRLIEWDKTPTLLVENTYANEWCDDYGVALLGSLADKALAIYEETGKEVRVAIPKRSGYEGHDTNIQLLPAMEKFSEKYKVYINEENLNIKPAKSKNTIEYWDCGPNEVASGRRVHFDVNYISFGGKDNEE